MSTASDDVRFPYRPRSESGRPPLNSVLPDDSSYYMDEKTSRVSMESSDRSEADSRVEENRELLGKEERDLEAATIRSTATPVEYTVSTSKKLVYLGLYFLLNLAVTLSNKALLQTVSAQHAGRFRRVLAGTC